jgi:hypothetical protein
MDGRVEFFDGPKPVSTYHLGPTPAQVSAGDSPARRPFMYPVLGPDGDALTNFGKPHDPTGSHAHHYSLWVAHADVGGVDFWSEQGGAIVSHGEPDIETGPVFCRLTHATRWVHAGRELLHERRRVTLHRTAGDADVTLGKTTFGFLAARVARSMSVFDGGGEILTARGGRNERGAHLTRAEWLDQSGPVAEGRWAGVALLDHPANPNHPTLWHCRNDGWAGGAFAGEAPYTIKPGQPLRLSYRVILHRGNAEEGEVARRFSEFAAKPVVRIGTAGELAD